MAWQEPRDASAYCTGLAAASAPPSAGGSSTLNVCAPVLMSTSVTPTSVPCAANTACAWAASASIALWLSAITASSDIASSPREAGSHGEPASGIVYLTGLHCQDLNAGTR